MALKIPSADAAFVHLDRHAAAMSGTVKTPHMIEPSSLHPGDTLKIAPTCNISILEALIQAHVRVQR